MTCFRTGLVLCGTIALLLASGCAPDEPLLESVDTTSAAVLGTVLTLTGEPVVDALVEVGEVSVRTDAAGRFELTGLAQDQDLELLVRSPRHSTGHMPLRLADRQQLHVTLRVLDSMEHQVDAAVGGRVERDDGVVIDLPGGFLDASGQPVTGQVTVRSAAIRTLLAMRAAPGGMMARTDEGDVALESFGMVEVELTSGGEPVELAGPARLEVPLPAASRFVEGESIPFWSFDEELGRWVRDGEGEVFGGTVVAEVEHFTWWNPDVKIRTACVRGRLVTVDEVPVTGGVYGEGIDYMGSSYAWSGSDGSFEIPLQVSSRASLSATGPLDSGEDSLFHFKQGFSRQRHQFSLWKWVLRQTVVHSLAREKERYRAQTGRLASTNGFFPQYLCPSCPCEEVPSYRFYQIHAYR